MTKNHQNKGLRYPLERDRAEHMDAESLENQANNPNASATEQAAARDTLLDRADGSGRQP